MSKLCRHMDGEHSGRGSVGRGATRASVTMALVNVMLGSVIGHAWLIGLPSAASPKVFFFTYCALVSSVAMLALLPALVLAGLSALLPFARLLGWIHAGLWTGFQLLIFVDTVIYRIFRYHFNASLWNVLTTAGSGDAVAIGPRDWVPTLICTILGLLAQRVLWRVLRSRPASATPRPWLLRPSSWMLMAVLGASVIERGLYARADLMRDREITSRSRRYPLYLPLTLKRFFSGAFGYDLAARARVDVSLSGYEVAYPLEPLRIPEDGPRPNVLIVVIDSLRRDMLNEQHMPVVTEWARGARRFENHLSGGNATRFGLFSLLYGLHGSYWTPFYNEQCPPVLVTALTEIGYESRVLSSASMSYPELRSTAWVTIEDKVEDSFPKGIRDRNLRDDRLARRFDEWLGERERRQDPFFAFILLDSPHQPYWPAPDLKPHQPSSDHLDYLELASSPSPEQISALFNRYKNAVAHADRVTGRILAALERHGQANTLVVITGDHGEEFFEYGHFGHTSSFTAPQAAVPFVLGGPGVEAGVETRATAHVDFVPTLFELLGVDVAQRSSYSLGYNLLDPPEKRLRVVAGWDELGLWVERGILYLPLKGYFGSVRAFDYSWRPHPQEDGLIRSHAAETARLFRQCRRFLR